MEDEKALPGAVSGPCTGYHEDDATGTTAGAPLFTRAETSKRNNNGNYGKRSLGPLPLNSKETMLLARPREIRSFQLAANNAGTREPLCALSLPSVSRPAIQDLPPGERRSFHSGKETVHPRFAEVNRLLVDGSVKLYRSGDTVHCLEWSLVSIGLWVRWGFDDPSFLPRSKDGQKII